jgi:hypothetical protein
VLKDGMPVCVHEDGKEFVHDIDASVRKIENLTQEKIRVHQKKDELQSKLNEYADIDIESAREALEKVRNIKDKRLLDDQGVKALKTELKASFEESQKQLVESHQAEIAKYKEGRQRDQGIIFNLMVENEFAKSDYFAGEKRKTIYPPNDAAKIFGDHFKVGIDDDTGKPRVTAELDEVTIMSRENHGEPAGFHEAIGIIIDKHPYKETILRTKAGSGPDASGNRNPDPDKGKDTKPIDRIAAGLRARQNAA